MEIESRTVQPTADRTCKGMLLVSLLTLSAAASALPAVTYTAVDLPNADPLKDLWRYDYVVHGPLGPFESVNLLFSPTLYEGPLTIESIDDPPLSASTIDPDPGLATDGQVTLSASSALGAGDSATAAVSFIWLGGAAGPASQPFEHLDDGFNVIATGATRIAGAVPEPSAIALLLLGIPLLVPYASRRLLPRR